MLKTVIKMDEKRKAEIVFLTSAASTRNDVLPFPTDFFPMSQSDSTLEVVAGTSIKRSLLFRNMCVTHFYQECARKSSGSVRVDIQEFAGMPVIIGAKGNVPLRDFVNALDESIDITELRQEFPELNAAQISDAMDFLRQLSEFNIEGFDPSAEEDRLIESSHEFQDSVRRSILSEPVNVQTSH